MAYRKIVDTFQSKDISIMVRGCGLVDRAVDCDNSFTFFESRHLQKFIKFLLLTVEKTK